MAQHEIERKSVRGAWAHGVIASANAGAHLDVTLRWHGSAGKPDGDVAPV